MSGFAAALGTCGLILLGLGPPPLGYVLPGERLLQVIQERRAGHAPLSVATELSGIDAEWPRAVQLELHPQAGLRATDDLGGRWVVRGGALVSGSAPRLPRWLPDLALLSMSLEADLQSWLARVGVDATQNQLARCGAADCFVLGGRSATRQVWIDKDRLEVVRWVAGPGRELRFDDYTDWGELRFPRRIEIRYRGESLAVLTVLDAAPAPELVPADFSPDWVGAGSRSPRD